MGCLMITTFLPAAQQLFSMVQKTFPIFKIILCIATHILHDAKKTLCGTHDVLHKTENVARNVKMLVVEQRPSPITQKSTPEYKFCCSQCRICFPNTTTGHCNTTGSSTIRQFALLLQRLLPREQELFAVCASCSLWCNECVAAYQIFPCNTKLVFHSAK